MITDQMKNEILDYICEAFRAERVCTLMIASVKEIASREELKLILLDFEERGIISQLVESNSNMRFVISLRAHVAHRDGLLTF